MSSLKIGRQIERGFWVLLGNLTSVFFLVAAFFTFAFSEGLHEFGQAYLRGGTPLDAHFFQNVAKGLGAAGLALFVGRDWQRRRMAYELSETLHSLEMLGVRQELSELMKKARLLK